MDNRRSVAIVIAAFAAILVMIAGKACSSPANQNGRTNKQRSSVSDNANYPTAANYNNNNNNNQPPQPPGGTYPSTETEDEGDDIPDNVRIEYVTNMFGEVKATEYVTLPTAAPTEVQEDDDTEQPEATTKRSLLDDYNDDSEEDDDNGLSGYKHKKKEKKKTQPTVHYDPDATLPEDWVIEVR